MIVTLFVGGVSGLPSQAYISVVLNAISKQVFFKAEVLIFRKESLVSPATAPSHASLEGVLEPSLLQKGWQHTSLGNYKLH